MSSWVTGCELLRLKRSKTPLPRVTQEERLKGGHQLSGGFPGGLEVKASASNSGDPGSIPGSGRSPGEGNGNPLQYSCLENPMDGGAWWATVHGVAKSRTRLSDFTSLHFISSLMVMASVSYYRRRPRYLKM